MTNDKSTGVITEPNDPEQKPEQPAKIDLPDPELPDLTRLYKRRCRDGDIMQKCKHLLIAGMLPGKVALMLRLPLEKVQNLYDNSYNPRCRRFAKANSYQNSRLAFTSFNEGADLSAICTALGLSLYWVVMSLRQNGVTDAAMAPRFPPYDHSLYVEYRRVCERKAASRFKAIQINPVRRINKNQAGKPGPRTRPQP
ncbi:hypothetical protein ACRAOD_22940 [Raoultella ornithinolytica]|uniref:hypothetical protein n=1 Tax=Raoultella ornithinolytica TaxID=54291 RepID=UPI0021BAACEC|nr:hypothetical protein [Raoultella ornithinolytica]MCT8172392.1 hypothetical protein [Raoultella ornithinolytica]